MNDLISRKAAIDVLKAIPYHNDGMVFETLSHALRDIELLSPAQHEQKRGRWIKQNPMVDTEECSECGYNILGEEFETPFCPWCGADMRGEEDERMR